MRVLLCRMHGYVHPMGKPYRGVFGEKEELNGSRFWHQLKMPWRKRSSLEGKPVRAQAAPPTQQGPGRRLDAKLRTQEKSSRQARSTGLQGQAGIARTSGDGKGPSPGLHPGLHRANATTQAALRDSVSRTTSEPCFPSQSAFPDGRRPITPLQFPGQLRGHGYRQAHSWNEKLQCQ